MLGNKWPEFAVLGSAQDEKTRASVLTRLLVSLDLVVSSGSEAAWNAKIEERLELLTDLAAASIRVNAGSIAAVPTCESALNVDFPRTAGFATVPPRARAGNPWRENRNPEASGNASLSWAEVSRVFQDHHGNVIPGLLLATRPQEQVAAPAADINNPASARPPDPPQENTPAQRDEAQAGAGTWNIRAASLSQHFAPDAAAAQPGKKKHLSSNKCGAKLSEKESETE